MSNSNHVFTVEPGDVFRTVYPASLAEEYGADYPTEHEAWYALFMDRHNHPHGYEWKIGDSERCARALWKSLGNVPTDDSDQIDEPWLIFNKGVHREDIWHWFEDEFGVWVADLMGLTKNKKVAKYHTFTLSITEFDEGALNESPNREVAAILRSLADSVETEGLYDAVANRDGVIKDSDRSIVGHCDVEADV